jgi:hypothetical protein
MVCCILWSLMCIFRFFCSYECYEVLYTSSDSYVNLSILVTSGIIPLKVVADGAVASLNNMKVLLNCATGFLKA